MARIPDEVIERLKQRGLRAAPGRSARGETETARRGPASGCVRSTTTTSRPGDQPEERISGTVSERAAREAT